MNVLLGTSYKKKNSTVQMKQGDFKRTVPCQLKEPCDMLNPTIIISNIVGAVYNYAFIPAWNRYYFVTNVTFLTGNRTQYDLSVDVLASWKSQISSYTCFVERSESSYNNLFDDEYVSNTENINYRASTSTEQGQGFSGSGCYTIRCVGANSKGTGITTYVTNEAGMLSFCQSLFDTTRYGFLADEIVKSFFNPFQYVVSIMWLPLNFAQLVGGTDNQTANIVCGWFDTGQLAYLLDADGIDITTDIKIPDNPYSDFRKYSDRFSHYQMYLPCVGMIPLNAANAANGLRSTLRVDSLTGYANYIITSANAVVGTYKTQLGVPIQIAQLNSGALNMIGQMSNAVVSAASGNFAGAANDIVNSAKTAFNPTASVNGANGDKYTIIKNPRIVVSLECRGSGERATATVGRPCFSTKKLGDLSGYVKCGNASVPCSGFDEERDMINNFLNNGFFME